MFKNGVSIEVFNDKDEFKLKIVVLKGIRAVKGYVELGELEGESVVFDSSPEVKNGDVVFKNGGNKDEFKFRGELVTFNIGRLEMR